jgi:hypothetical protein
MPTPQAQASNLSRPHFIEALLLLVYLLRDATPPARSASGPNRGLDDFKSAKTVMAAKIRLNLGKGSGASLSQ